MLSASIRFRRRRFPDRGGEEAPPSGDVTLSASHLPVVDAEAAARIAREGVLLDARAESATGVRPSRWTVTAACAGYHHGDLPAALRAAAVDIIEEAGIGGISLSRAARRAGVSTGAPYQHYRDGQALLVDIAVHGSRDLAAVMRRVAARDPAELLGKLAAAQTRFARTHHAVYSVMCHCALSQDVSPELVREGEQVIQIIRQAARRLAGPAGAENLTLAAVAVAQGFALLYTSTSVTAGASTARMAAQARRVTTVLARNAIDSHGINAGTHSVMV